MPSEPFTPKQKRDLKRLLRDLQAHFDGAAIYPRGNVLLDRVVLAHASKALTVARSVMCLVDAGYPEEAFGLSRTMVEIGLNLRFITNRYSERRAKRFVDYNSRWRLELVRRALKHFYKMDEQGRPILGSRGRKIRSHTKAELHQQMSAYKKYLRFARKYPNRTSWTETHNPKSKGGVYKMAKESDRYEFINGVPVTWEFDYDWMYFWSSQYVHATVVCMDSHAVYPGKPFSIHNAPERLKHTEGMAAFNSAVQLHKILMSAFRAIGHEYPPKFRDRLGNLLLSMIGKVPIIPAPKSRRA